MCLCNVLRRPTSSPGDPYTMAFLFYKHLGHMWAIAVWLQSQCNTWQLGQMAVCSLPASHVTCDCIGTTWHKGCPFTTVIGTGMEWPLSMSIIVSCACKAVMRCSSQISLLKSPFPPQGDSNIHSDTSPKGTEMSMLTNKLFWKLWTEKNGSVDHDQ